MIGDLIIGKEKSRITLIEDSVLQNGRAILLSLLCQMCDRVDKVCFICFERDPIFLMNMIPERYKNSIICYDGSKDLLGWEDPGSLNINTDLPVYLQNDLCNSNHHTTGIVIDCLSPLLLQRPPSYTCNTLTGLLAAKIHSAEVEHIACLLHRDLHDRHCLSLVEHVVTTVIKVKPPLIPQFLLSCHILHKRLSGKVIKITEHLNLDEHLSPVDITEIKSVDTSQVAVDGSQSDPTANLTFNLSLTDKEKEAKSQVKLPYTYDSVRQEETLNKSVGEGKIFYQPDEADDFDEEDPDEDLDI